MRCMHVSFSADGEMSFQASCKGGRGQCRQMQFSCVVITVNKSLQLGMKNWHQVLQVHFGENYT